MIASIGTIIPAVMMAKTYFLPRNRSFDMAYAANEVINIVPTVTTIATKKLLNIQRNTGAFSVMVT